MNTKIWQLYGESIVDVTDNGADILSPEMFAELIVKECAEFIEQDQGSGQALANRLKSYFGVTQ